MAKKVDTPLEVEQFPICLKEFLDQIPDRQIETKTSFQRLMNKECMGSKHLPKAAWQEFFGLFKSKPVGTPWATWTRKGGQ